MTHLPAICGFLSCHRQTPAEFYTWNAIYAGIFVAIDLWNERTLFKTRTLLMLAVSLCWLAFAALARAGTNLLDSAHDPKHCMLISLFAASAIAALWWVISRWSQSIREKSHF